MDRPEREKIIEWLIARRRSLQEKKERHLAKKPQDKQGAMLCGIKARALQEVINYLESQPLIPDEEEIRKKVKAIQNPYTAEFFPRDDKWAGQILREKGLTEDEIGGVSGALGRVAFEYIMAEIDRFLET